MSLNHERPVASVIAMSSSASRNSPAPSGPKLCMRFRNAIRRALLGETAALEQYRDQLLAHSPFVATHGPNG